MSSELCITGCPLVDRCNTAIKVIDEAIYWRGQFLVILQEASATLAEQLDDEPAQRLRDLGLGAIATLDSLDEKREFLNMSTQYFSEGCSGPEEIELEVAKCRSPELKGNESQYETTINNARHTIFVASQALVQIYLPEALSSDPLSG